ncbi:MAG: hypothetical protein FWG80_04340 [Alphaproteobacteria bacterium]|nr:hypothetical protein [Alphaproteobacteria bacterium]
MKKFITIFFVATVVFIFNPATAETIKLDCMGNYAVTVNMDGDTAVLNIRTTAKNPMTKAERMKGLAVGGTAFASSGSNPSLVNQDGIIFQKTDDANIYKGLLEDGDSLELSLDDKGYIIWIHGTGYGCAAIESQDTE